MQPNSAFSIMLSMVGYLCGWLAGNLLFCACICVYMRPCVHVSQSFCAMAMSCRAAITDSCGVVQLSFASSAVTEVIMMNQLLRWGKFASLCLFHQDILGHLEWPRWPIVMA